jgi:hypothetical protein
MGFEIAHIKEQKHSQRSDFMNLTHNLINQLNIYLLTYLYLTINYINKNRKKYL